MLSNSTSNQEILGNDAPGEASLLVSEFPPPPSYYKTAVRLEPPPIPHDALTRGTQRAAAAAARSRAQAERLRLQGENSTDAILGGLATATPSELEENDNEPVVAVFGEIVEDPLLVKPLDDCEDPTVVREQVKKLNLQVVQGFVKLVQDLVHRPMENKKTRDALSHHVFLMLQECNKFREHQAREILIDLLEKQLQQRNNLLAELQEQIRQADQCLL